MTSTRAAGIHGLGALARRHGQDAGDLAREVGLDPLVLCLPEVPVADRKLDRLLERAADRLGLADLGLRLAAEHDLGMLGPLGTLLANAPTLELAFTTAARHLPMHADGLRLRRGPDPLGDPDVVALHLDRPGGAPAPVQDANLGFLHRALSALTGAGTAPAGVLLAHRPDGGTQLHEAFFGAPVSVTGRCSLRVPRSLFERPVPGADPRVWAGTGAVVACWAPQERTLPAQVRARVRTGLPHGRATLEEICRALAIEPRTLQRRLNGYGTTFGDLLDAERRDQARILLTGTDLPLHQISAHLGFADPATLSRAGRRWWGLAPGRIRAGHPDSVVRSQVVRRGAGHTVRQTPPPP